MSEISQELVERMVAFVRRVADYPPGLLAWHSDSPPAMECREIAALLPDPDIRSAREIGLKIAVENGYMHLTEDYLNGGHDKNDTVIAALYGIKRGRELSA